MKKTLLSREIFYLAILFAIGGTAIIGQPGEIRDSWLGCALVPAFAVPVCLIFSGLSAGNEPIMALKAAVGKHMAPVLLLLLSAVAIFVCTATVNTYVEYVSSMSMVLMRRWVPAFGMCLICAIISKGNTASFIRICWSVLPIAALVVAVVLFVAIKVISFGNLLPIAENGVMPIANFAMRGVVLQVAPMLFMFLRFTPQAKTRRPAVPVLLAVLAACVVLCLLKMKNVGVLGWPLIGEFRFPGSVAASALKVGGGKLLERFELFMVIVVAVTQPIKISVCLSFAAEGVSKVFPRLQKYAVEALAAAVALLSLIPPDGYPIEGQRWYHVLLAVALLGVPMALFALRRIRRR